MHAHTGMSSCGTAARVRFVKGTFDRICTSNELARPVLEGVLVFTYQVCVHIYTFIEFWHNMTFERTRPLYSMGYPCHIMCAQCLKWVTNGNKTFLGITRIHHIYLVYTAVCTSNGLRKSTRPLCLGGYSYHVHIFVHQTSYESTRGLSFTYVKVR